MWGPKIILGKKSANPHLRCQRIRRSRKRKRRRRKKPTTPPRSEAKGMPMGPWGHGFKASASEAKLGVENVGKDSINGGLEQKYQRASYIY